jgi:hypothetical protein
MSASISAPVEWIETIGQLRLPRKTDRRLQQLMDRNTEGSLTETERHELESLVDLGEQLSLLRSQALRILGKKP